ncbi:acyl-CoA dehydrogenase [Tistrella bauzanensis]|uniref:Acyl-[acyl-carrier-protein] dehydrogenase MbtN n=1 Tax=Tistrella bauzanensis TaxID=657419 RepID=A0ABQ1I8V3_9PROT|nr:acyl-CoA dehydrogenase family protein [Tistrella bauzanensis]GGB28339.1 acyl-CoA dehydrogenase [Tistrella bauzanensis]
MLAERANYGPEHDALRYSVQRFFESEIAPNYADWEKRGYVDRDVWRKAGSLGLLCSTVPEEYGGPGGDFLTASVIIEEQMRQGYSAPGFYTHSDIIAPYILEFGSEALKRRWLPRMASGEAIAAIAMTEPGAGSDLKAIRTHARRDGCDFIINGAKTFITNGYLADLVVVAAKTAPEKGAHGISLIVVETKTPGFRCGQILEKMGQKAQDTVELFFDEVRVPASNLIGDENQGFSYLMRQLAQERLAVAVSAIGWAKGVLADTVRYTRDRQVFGSPLMTFQNTQFKLAECRAEIMVGEAYVDRCITRHMEGRLTDAEAAAAKMWLSEMQARVIDTCLQFFGGYGYMSEYPVARAYTDARAQRIYGGANEIMRMIIARSL